MTNKTTLQTDVLVIGGGINGAGVAADAALRGLSVTLCESNDLAWATSSASSKLIHGGLRYLEQYEFKLVKKSLKEREVLINKAPHLIHPLRFILPHAKHLRPKWMIRSGMFLYDFLAGRQRSLPKSKKVDLRQSLEGEPLKPDWKVGFSYYDCRVDDARLVVANVQQAQQQGAQIFVPYRCDAIEPASNETWRAKLVHRDKPDQVKWVEAKAVVNAAGPWVAELLDRWQGAQTNASVRLVKGSHIVVPKLYEGDHAYILQNSDGRIVFALPYGFDGQGMNRYTAIGTTDIDYQADPVNVIIDDAEKHYLCDLISDYFNQPVTPDQIISDWSGVRPLYNDHQGNAAEITRDYHIDVVDDGTRRLGLSIFGGKLTTYRQLAQQVVNQLAPYFPNIGPCKTADTPLPGGQADSFESIITFLQQQYPWLDSGHCYRLASAYGMATPAVLQSATSYQDLGQDFGHHLYEAEVRYLVENEWCYDINALLWRRTKHGLLLTQVQQDALQQWFSQHYRN